MSGRRVTRRQVVAGGIVGMAGLVAPRGAAEAGATATAAAAGTLTVGGDLVVNRMGFGAMRITGPGIWGEPKDPAEAHRVLRRAVELGVDFIDTADSYGPEVSERLIAEALHPYPENLVIATKGGLLRPGPGRWDPDGRPEHLRAACEGSLKRLQLDEIPLYQLHPADPRHRIRRPPGGEHRRRLARAQPGRGRRARPVTAGGGAGVPAALCQLNERRAGMGPRPGRRSRRQQSRGRRARPVTAGGGM